VSPAPEPCAALAAHRLTKVYPSGTRALDGVDLEVAAGETLALVGESGSGKTTLLRCFNRTVEPSAGEAWVEGRPVAGADPVALRRGLGYVQQEGGLLPHWRVLRNVELVPWLLGWERERRRRRAREVLELVGLDPDEVGGRYPRQLSGGQRQRVAVARALAAEPRVVLLDEPFGALDALTRAELQRELLGIVRDHGRTMLLVTHDLAEAFALADRVAVMRRGRILQVAPPAELAARPAHPYVESLLELRR
jgi:osmoprotectant transport system ATP-binding protein